MGMTLTGRGKRSVRSKKREKREARINVTYCLIHPKAIFKKLLIYSRVCPDEAMTLRSKPPGMWCPPGGAAVSSDGGDEES